MAHSAAMQALINEVAPALTRMGELYPDVCILVRQGSIFVAESDNIGSGAVSIENFIRLTNNAVEGA